MVNTIYTMENQMPTQRKKSNVVSKKIKKLKSEGKSKRQSIAIALSMVGKKKKPSRPRRGQRTKTNNRRR